MRKLLFWFLLFCFSTQGVYAVQDTTRVLFIGNSLTYTDSVPALVKGLADAAGLQFRYFVIAPPGATVGDTSQGTYAHMFNPDVYAAIRADDWDFVCLQDNQGRFILGNGRFPDPVAFKIIEGHFKIMDSVKYYHPCAHMVWFAGWAFKNGYAGLSTTGKGLIDNIYQNYVYLKDTAGELISPIGIAWERAMVALPKTDLWAPDETHESLFGAYLTAATLFSTIYRRNIDDVAFNGGLKDSTAKTLRQIAYQTFVDSSAANNVDTYSPGLHADGTTLYANAGYATYYWYKDGALVSTGTDNRLVMTAPGCYQVVAVDAGGCQSRSMEQCIATLGFGNMQVADGIKVYPVPAVDALNIALPATWSGSKTITLTDATGRVVRQYAITNNSAVLDTRGIVSGVYVLAVQGEVGVYHMEVLVR